MISSETELDVVIGVFQQNRVQFSVP
uniref:Uncharacterized protein n=1 Tax=Rhizophora mucronata TaxID=61149 RepID=A0A2P2NEH0_RHIMU